jgi:hypothetical protein
MTKLFVALFCKSEKPVFTSRAPLFEKTADFNILKAEGEP